MFKHIEHVGFQGCVSGVGIKSLHSAPRQYHTRPRPTTQSRNNSPESCLAFENRPILIFASTDEQYLLENIRIIGMKAPTLQIVVKQGLTLVTAEHQSTDEQYFDATRRRILMELLFGQIDTNKLTRLPTYLTWYQCGDRKAHRVSRSLSCWQKGTHYSAEALSGLIKFPGRSKSSFKFVGRILAETENIISLQ